MKTSHISHAESTYIFLNPEKPGRENLISLALYWIGMGLNYGLFTKTFSEFLISRIKWEKNLYNPLNFQYISLSRSDRKHSEVKCGNKSKSWDIANISLSLFRCSHTQYIIDYSLGYMLSKCPFTAASRAIHKRQTVEV